MPRKAPSYLQFPSLDSPGRERWTISLESDLLTLSDPGSQRVLQLHREEAARYMRFTFDLFRGRTISLIIIEGVKQYSFACSREQMAKLLGWLPHLSQEEIEEGVRRSGLIMALLGVFHILLPAMLLWVWGVLLFAAGLAGTLRPSSRMCAVNAAVLFGVGLWDLLTGSPQDIRPWNVPPEHRWLAVVVGSAFLMWAVQQLSMLGPNRQLRISRGIRDRRVSFLSEQSRLVRRLGFANLLASAVCGAYAAAMLATFFARAASAGPALIPGLHPALHDAVVFGAVAILALTAGVVLLCRNVPPYLEAKVSAQMLLALSVFSVWGLVFNGYSILPLAGFVGIFGANLDRFSGPWVWISLVLCVALFNRWFARSLDRELEEQRG